MNKIFSNFNKFKKRDTEDTEDRFLIIEIFFKVNMIII